MVFRPAPSPSAPVGQEPSLGDSFITTKLDAVVNWGRRNSLWPFPFGTACCAIEFGGTVSSMLISRDGRNWCVLARAKVRLVAHRWHRDLQTGANFAADL